MTEASTNPPAARDYVGRFAPSPTGPLHFGSLVAATASFLDAKASGGQWLVRMEDLDPEREQPGAAATILQTLEAFGFTWDTPVVRQSGRTGLYRHAFSRLETIQAVYPCACSRKEIAEASGPCYPGTCRNGIPTDRQPTSWRVRVPDEIILFEDRIQGSYAQNLAQTIGDFVVKRLEHNGPIRRETFPYQLAVVVDDAAQNVTHIVRGADLLDSTPRQIYLHRLLNLAVPRYAHIAVATDQQGNKLSKQTGAPALNPTHPAADLVAALRFLGQRPPPDLERAPVQQIWTWAIAHWSIVYIPTRAADPA